MYNNLTILSSFCFCLFSQSLLAQAKHIKSNVWTTVSQDKQTESAQITLFSINLSLLKEGLKSAPSEADYKRKAAPDVILDLPNPEGKFTSYKIWDFAILHPHLQAQFPEIRSFCGENIHNSSDKIFCSISQIGFHSMTYGASSKTIFIEPFQQHKSEYKVYYKTKPTSELSNEMRCLLDDSMQKGLKKGNKSENTSNCGIRREYRLALACTGEYATFHGGTTADALAAMNTTMTRINGVFLSEIGVKMNLVSNNTNIIYLNGASDPYSNEDGFAMLDENQSNLDAVIGSANYDIGHVFSTGGGGIAALNSPCNNTIKAQGVTGSFSPIGDFFDIDLVAHEFGHQFGALHTFSSNDGACFGNGSMDHAFEPGSGSTILAYAGICAPGNIQNFSDPYFHAGSLNDFAVFLTSTSNNCPTEFSTTNNSPVLAPISNLNIPAGTPFVLNGSATDPENDPMTFCWEQMNADLVSPPMATTTTGPLFRSFPPVTTTYRYFPDFNTVYSGSSNPWEILSTVDRTLQFRLTARDNQVTGGCTDEEDTNVIVHSTTGPFRLIYPNGNDTLTAGQQVTVTWDVVGTNSNGVNAATVDILYSSDPTNPTSYVSLLTNTPNDGSESLKLPASLKKEIRLMVRSHSTTGNFFYDISNSNIQMVLPCPTTPICHPSTVIKL